MQLLIVRHGIAHDRVAWTGEGFADDARPLTEEGERRVRKIARGLAAELATLDLIATSPLVRARATADLLAEAFAAAPVVELTELAPTAELRDLLPWLKAQRALPRVAVVGHEPHLSLLAGWLVTGREKALCELKKGGACLLELGARVAPGTASLVWLLSAGQARRLAP